jgi:hypothetical protein
MSETGSTRVVVIALVALLGSLPLCGPADAKKPGGKGHGVVTRTASVSGVGTETILTATATCPKRTRALGGGFAVVPPPAGVLPLLQESQLVGRTAWRASVQLNDIAGGSAPTTLTTSVNCRRKAPKMLVVSTVVPVPDPGSNPVLGPSATAVCPTGRMLMAGGFLTGPALVMGDVRSLVIDSKPDGNAWTSRVISNGQNTLNTFAYCARKRIKGIKQVTPRRRTAAVPGVSSSDPRLLVAARCPLGRKPIAGGFSQTASLAMGGGYFIPFGSTRSARTWSVNAIQASPSTTISLAGTVLCL